MDPTLASSVEIPHLPPKSPGSTSQTSPTRTSSPRRSRFFNTFRSRNKTQSQNADDDDSPKTLGRRRFVRNIFNTFRHRKHQDSDESQGALLTGQRLLHRQKRILLPSDPNDGRALVIFSAPLASCPQGTIECPRKIWTISVGLKIRVPPMPTMVHQA